MKDVTRSHRIVFNGTLSAEPKPVTYRTPSIEEFVPGFEFEVLVLYDLSTPDDDKWIPMTVEPGYKIDAVGHWLDAGHIRTATPKKQEKPAKDYPRKVNDEPLIVREFRIIKPARNDKFKVGGIKSLLLFCKETPIGPDEPKINETQCENCQSLILFITEPHCVICEARQLRK